MASNKSRGPFAGYSALKICATLNVPLPAGKAINIEGGIANDPAVTAAWQTKPTGTIAPPAVVINDPP